MYRKKIGSVLGGKKCKSSSQKCANVNISLIIFLVPRNLSSATLYLSPQLPESNLS